MLLARIGALLRRSRGALASGAQDVAVRPDCPSKRLRAPSTSTDRASPCPATSSICSSTWPRTPGKIQSRETLFKDLFKREYDGMDRMLDIRISRLRRKLGDEAETAERIKTIWGQGYLFVPDAW